MKKGYFWIAYSKWKAKNSIGKSKYLKLGLSIRDKPQQTHSFIVGRPQGNQKPLILQVAKNNQLVRTWVLITT